MATPKAIVTMSDNNALPNPDAENKVNTLPGKSKAFVKKHEPEKIDKMGDKGSEESQFTADGVKKDETKKASYRAGKDAEVYEETMSDAEKSKRERIVKGMKKNAADFKSKYGSRWKSVMYATATKAAMEEVELEEGMASSVIKSKQKYAEMSDKDFADKHGSKSETELKAMAWRHGYGKDSNVYVNKVKKGSSMSEATLSAKAGAAGKDLGKPGKNFAKIVDDATERYGSKEAGKRVAGAILAKMRNEEVEQIDEISKSTLGSYATKALRRGDIAARMSHSDTDEMGKIAAKRIAGVKKAVERIAPKSPATVGKIKANIDKAREAARNRYTDKDDQGKAYYAAQKGISKIREETESIDEVASAYSLSGRPLYGKKAEAQKSARISAAMSKLQFKADQAKAAKEKSMAKEEVELDEVNLMRKMTPKQMEKLKSARMAAALSKLQFKADQAKAAKEKSLTKEEAENELLYKLYESLSDSNKKLMDVMLEDGRVDELLEFAMEQFNDDV